MADSGTRIPRRIPRALWFTLTVSVAAVAGAVAVMFGRLEEWS